ncbi:glutamate-rich protein 2 isoform X1 [Gopherus evgoodei]|uniref:glutamate-rich protein 2 isoform X1 n=2 Tax=Gopherus evgoodei TaxID=1825980 RepID=UPI0011CFF407|nr:glutamate-rich protein 2 isoform X1 [Gopherus evgoodei]
MNRCEVGSGPGTPRNTTPKVSGMLDVVGPDDGFILEACLTMSRQDCLERTDAIKDQKNGQNGRLHVFGPKSSMDVDQNLQRKFILQQNKSHYVQLNQLLKNDDKEKNSRNVGKPVNNELSTEFQTNSIEDHNIDEQLSETTDDDESSSENSENEDRKRNAPIELLGEFLKAIMDQDYNLSKKLCQMILIYEPENTEAKQFLPLLEEKLLIESTQNFGNEEGEETDEGSSEDSEEDTSSSDSSDDEGEESSDDSDENV